jgi:cellulose synthase/poly-beta-1,6-N-acetylglucosamine synthase-like glycosyltransferase
MESQIYQWIVTLTIAGYISYSLIILCVYLIATIRVWKFYKPSPELNIENQNNPKVSIILPAYNEEVSIVDSVKSVLNQDYNNIEIIIVNDGSTDDTKNILIKEFNLKYSKSKLEKFDELLLDYPDFYFSELDSLYFNKNITLINTTNGGKSSALNFGIIYSDSDFILNIDADTILIKTAISKTLSCMRPDCDAVSCFVGVANGNEISNGEIIKHEVPKKILPRIQWLEYVRSFILWRTANDKQNATLVMPGAYSFVRKNTLIDSGGYKPNFLSEDMELTLNIIRNKKKIQFISEFFAWTEVPENLKSLTKQRLRWYRGGLQNLLKYRKLTFSRKHSKFTSFYMLPFLWFADVIGIWVELFGIIQIIIFYVMSINVNWNLFFISWTIIAVTYYIIMTLLILFVKYKLIGKNEDLKLYRTIPIIFFEIFTYHYINLYWMLKSHTNHYLGRMKKWDKFERVGFLKRN